MANNSVGLDAHVSIMSSPPETGSALHLICRRSDGVQILYLLCMQLCYFIISLPLSKLAHSFVGLSNSWKRPCFSVLIWYWLDSSLRWYDTCAYMMAWQASSANNYFRLLVSFVCLVICLLDSISSLKLNLVIFLYVFQESKFKETGVITPEEVS